MRTWIILAMVSAVLLVAVTLQFMATRGPAAPGKGRHLATVLPTAIAGGMSTELPLGRSEAASDAVADVLRFDDVFYRAYRMANGAEFSLYVAYWKPGKMPVQLVASHTPDRCWSSAGWTCRASDYHATLTVPGVNLPEAQGRLFTNAAGAPQHVLYWHLIGDRCFDFGERSTAVPDPVKWWREVARQAFETPQEQYFIRLTSDRPFEQLRGDPGFEEVVRSLAALGLRAR